MSKKLFISVLALTLLAGCSGVNPDSQYPKPREVVDRARIGKITGEEGLTLFGGKRSRSSTADAINVNAYLWRATLDVVHFMPLLSADPFGGTVLTDWYQSPEHKKERFKVNVFIIGAELRSDALKVTAFRQVQDNSGNWRDQNVHPALAKEIEEKILLKARDLKVSSL